MFYFTKRELIATDFIPKVQHKFPDDQRGDIEELVWLLTLAQPWTDISTSATGPHVLEGGGYFLYISHIGMCGPKKVCFCELYWSEIGHVHSDLELGKVLRSSCLFTNVLL